MGTRFQVPGFRLLVAGLFISSVVNQMMCGFLCFIVHKKFPTFIFHSSLFTFHCLKLCCIIHQVIRIFWSGLMDLSLPVILSSDFCLIAQVSKITISASWIFSVYKNPQLPSTALILAASA